MQENKESKLKNFFIALFDIHSTIGKIFTTITLALVIAGLLGIIFGKSDCSNENEVVETNYFLREEVPLHDNNYTIFVSSAYSIEEITILDKKGSQQPLVGNFIAVDLLIEQNENSKLDEHVLDTNDFKLKDHTGVYLPLNEIMGAIGWDAIDVHIDSSDGGHVMSSADFSTTPSIKDYTYVDKSICCAKSFHATIYFELSADIKVETDLIVLEVDFYNFSNAYRQGTDIILLPRP